MKKSILCFTLLLGSLFLKSQTIIGKWRTIDDETGKAKSIVEIFKRGDKYYGKVVDILNPEKKNNTCKLCPDDRKDKAILGMEIIKDLVLDAGDKEYEDGTILDPSNGKIYDCKIWLENDNTLSVRGYVMFFFRTQTWLKVK